MTIDGGEGGIRTPGTRKRTIDFESTALDHSATSPKQMEILKSGLQQLEKILQRLKNADPVLQSVWALLIPAHQFYQVLSGLYANTSKKLNQVFTPLVHRIQKNCTRVF